MSVQPISIRFRPRRPATAEERLTAVETAIDYLNLPAGRPAVVRDDAVHVVVTSVEDYAAWVYALGGDSNRAPAMDGASLWTLRTDTPPGAYGQTVAIRVHVAVVHDEQLPVEFHPAPQGDEAVSA